MMELRIPAVGDAVADVHLVEWLVEDGVQVREGDPLFAIESDKSIVEINSPAGGILTKLEKAGDVFPVGSVIGTLS